ncbi:NAD(P)/FAD-dependent oxidoreductase [Arthrobacter sp. ISL-30]|uniref:FAD-dependent oxidoreductase n=1 Tax=Arthrobacter sp. ISL-30 TaxID=2819109 RepID=UPI001BEC2972|nr:NAD(P)/FAD-dependent oxidoreductase [Arthrobacter sp. ISL-30]MBT2514796.1 FAD-dependent monooxygenase [Arthrobacter sp. ISL-30]
MIDVAVVGGGPVGLLMAILLRLQGREVVVLERRTSRTAHSRAIGIHPPALRVLESAGVAPRLIDAGVRITHGTALSRGKYVAGLDFTGTSPTHPFILSVPQSRTETLLEARLQELAGDVLRRGVEVDGLLDDGGTPRVSARSGGAAVEFHSRLVVAADGPHSAIRQKIAPARRIRRYPDFYVMGDFRDDTSFGSEAILFLEPDGIVESFPLPEGIRRWVVWQRRPSPQPEPRQLSERIWARTGISVDATTNSMVSGFGVSSCLASQMICGSVFLVGDAAHEISPIGGQGMNLGWLDVAELAPLISNVLEGRPTATALTRYQAERRRAAKRAQWQAGLNMALGRPLPPSILALRNSLFSRAIAVPAIADVVAKRFTMN